MFSTNSLSNCACVTLMTTQNHKYNLQGNFIEWTCIATRKYKKIENFARVIILLVSYILHLRKVSSSLCYLVIL